MQQKLDNLTSQLHSILESRRKRGLIRSLTLPVRPCGRPLIDFASNDYLGIARSSNIGHIRNVAADDIANDQMPLTGATGSRLLTGNHQPTEQLESYLSNYHNSPAALVFNNGYTANLSIFSTIPQRGDVVLLDENIHASVYDGLKLGAGRAKVAKWKHGDVANLESLCRYYINIFIAIEGIYSMDGTIAPLTEIVEMKSRLNGNIYIIIDEAHSTGILGDGGRGLVSALNLTSDVFIRLHTFGKAMGCHGAAILCSETVKQYLINYSRPLVFSTFLSVHDIVTIRCASDKLRDVITAFRSVLGPRLPPKVTLLPSITPIQLLVIPSNESVVFVSQELRQRGFMVLPIRSPTVPAGTERLRICLHAFNSKEEIEELCEAIADCLVMLKNRMRVDCRNALVNDPGLKSKM
ncbi:pyridoxal phosphate-dependent transferase [Paraphysoderma sedebokerense]|nr:pyridoxal phosphate-dependent transferase [Paraphysoderma sedebokerense]